MNLLKLIKEAYAAAADGLWMVYGNGDTTEVRDGNDEVVCQAEWDGEAEGRCNSNLNFIATAHEAVPHLVNAADALQDFVDCVQGTDFVASQEHLEMITTRAADILAKLKEDRHESA